MKVIAVAYIYQLAKFDDFMSFGSKEMFLRNSQNCSGLNSTNVFQIADECIFIVKNISYNLPCFNHTRDHSFATYAQFYEKLTFLSP